MTLNRSISGQAIRDNGLFLLSVILARTWSESRSLVRFQDQIPCRCITGWPGKWILGQALLRTSLQVILARFWQGSRCSAKNGTDVRSSSVPIFAYSGQRPARSGCLWVHTFEALSVPLFCSSQSTSNAFARSYAQSTTRNAALTRGFKGFLMRTESVLISELVLRSELKVQVAKKKGPHHFYLSNVILRW